MGGFERNRIVNVMNDNNEWANNLESVGIFGYEKAGNINYSVGRTINGTYGGVVGLKMGNGFPIGSDIAPYNYSVKCFIKV